MNRHGNLVDLVLSTWSADEIRAEANRLGIQNELTDRSTPAALADEFVAAWARRGGPKEALLTRLRDARQDESFQVMLTQVALEWEVSLPVNAARESLVSEVPEAVSPSFSPSIVARMSDLRRTVTLLTLDQMQVLREIRYKHRAAVAGCAGSGKTLVAAEQAIRLDAAGLRTLLLCHSPFLAHHLRLLVAGSSVDVQDFGEFVRGYDGTRAATEGPWSTYAEPSDEEIERAFDAVGVQGRYDAIIADEGQDFRDIWWLLVEAALDYPAGGRFYVFYDDNQSLIPHRSKVPFGEPTVSMSKNCRNGGNVFEIVRRFHRDAPLVSMFLAEEGVARLTPFRADDMSARLDDALSDACRHIHWSNVVVLTNEVSVEGSVLSGFEFVPKASGRWWEFVASDLSELRAQALRRLSDLGSASSHSELANRFRLPLHQDVEAWLSLPVLSREGAPTSSDVAQVKRLAQRLRPFFGGRVETRMEFGMRGERQYLRKARREGEYEATSGAASRAAFYSGTGWVDALVGEEPVVLLPQADMGLGQKCIPLETIGRFKGLECDAVVLFVNSFDRNLMAELYVGASRAVAYLNVVIDRKILGRIRSLADLGSAYLVD